jgi:hypothetical protein
VPESSWKNLAQKKIYFGHQSVGYNIIDAIKDVMKENPQIKLRIEETKDPNDFSEPLLGHSKVGENRNPSSKSDAFRSCMEGGLGEKADIAFFKFCYVDIDAATDVPKTFQQYRSIMEEMRNKYPRVTFIHVTSPLTTQPTSLKDKAKRLVKKMIGRPIAHVEDNVKRENFNLLIRRHFGSEGRVFDLAAIESTNPDGRKSTFNWNGKTYPNLVSEYTCDGGHLNKTGGRVVAEQLLVLLARVAS